MERKKAKRFVPKEEKAVMPEKQYGVTEDSGGYACLLYMKRRGCAQQ
jgi:hypothetical protein